MVDKIDERQLSGLMKAVGDVTRRKLLTQLCQQGPTRVTELANYYDVSLNAISKHIKVLEKSRLVKRITIGREHWIEADLQRFAIIEHWFAEMKSIWQLRLDALDKELNGELNDD